MVELSKENYPYNFVYMFKDNEDEAYIRIEMLDSNQPDIYFDKEQFNILNELVNEAENLTKSRSYFKNK